MTIFTATFLILLLIIAVISTLRILRLPLPWKSRAPLLALRSVLLALIAVAFIEPVVVFEQIPARRGAVPVLIDASRSMRPFIQDSTVKHALAQLEAWNAAHAGGKQKFVFFSFGDSLIPLKNNLRSLDWSHRRSFLPESIKDPDARRSSAMLLISDGNWSNSSLPSANYSDKTVYYLPLPDARKRPYLHIALSGFPDASPIDSPLTASLSVEGVTDRNDDTLTVALIEKNRTLEKKKIPLSAGFFRNEVRITLRNAAPGRHLYRFEARMTADSLRDCCHALHSKLPERFHYAMYNARPSLDRRFVGLAIKSQPAFVESGADKTPNPDLLVLFDWDEKARKLFNSLKPGGAALFVGALPCSSASIRQCAVPQRVLRPQNETVSGGLFDDFDAGRLPPVSRITFCKSLPVMPQNVVLRVAMPAQERPRPGLDTLNLLFTGRINNRNYIACAAWEIWRWDFLPLAVEPDEDRAFSFSRRLMEFAKDMLINALSGELYLFPAAPQTESDSLGFRLVFPVDIPVPADVRISCRFTSARNGVFDTAFVSRSSGAPMQTVRFKPLPCGDWRLDASAKADNRRYQFADSVFIGEDRSEYMANTQNAALLQEIAQPISDFSASSLNSLFFPPASEINHPVKKTIHLNRSWLLLLLIFAVFSAEWILRRVLRLD